jgi:hypothetical protein
MCSGEESGASNQVSFRTTCSVIDIFPYHQGFDEMPISFEQECWESQAINGSYNFVISTSDIQGNYPFGQGMAKINYFVGETRLNTPVFDITSLDNPYVKFSFVNPSYSGNQETLTLQYRTNGGEWQNLMTINNGNETWITDSIALPEASEQYQISFKITGNNGWGVGIDEVFVYNGDEGSDNPNPDPEPCYPPTGISASNITQTSADITWNATASLYEIRIDAGTIETITTNSYTFTNLNPNTFHAVEVRAVCEEEVSTWVSTTFTTLEEVVTPEPCDAPTALAANNITETSAEITWNGTASTYEIKVNGGESETLTTTSKTLTNLTPNTAYTIEVRAVCEEQTSAWVSTNFTTLEEIIPEPEVILGEVSTLAATEVGNTSATLNGALVSAGNAENFTVGFALSTTADFTLETSEVQNITSTLAEGTFSQAVNDLAEGQTYFYRAYITNQAGTAYGAVETFTLSSLAEEISGTLQVSLYPNPAQDNATMEIVGLDQDAKIVISDLQGRILSQEAISAGTTRYTVNVSNMASGVYYIRIVTDKAVSTQKLIVE